MKVLLLGGGAREHALAYKLSLSPILSQLYLSSPNDGFKHFGENITFDNYKNLASMSKEKGIELLVVGPENPLADGIVDEFKKVGIPSIGADKKWAQLESSKAFAKDFMQRNNIPTARFEVITKHEEIETKLNHFKFPLVLKADGLTAGKSVQIVSTRQEAEYVLNDFLNGKYGEASKKIIIEEFLEGEEISLISIWDGKTLLPLIPARDYKRLMDNNEGPNTGGMGAYCPVKLNLEEKEKIKSYVGLLNTALVKEKANFQGIIYSGLMMTKNGVKVLEYNMRFGDPETQALMMHLETDLLYILKKALEQSLSDIDLSWKQGTSFCLVIASNGYPENPKTGCHITNIKEIEDSLNIKVFYAGVELRDQTLISKGGRVLSICKTNSRNDIYTAAEKLKFDDKIYRKDVGAFTSEIAGNYNRF